MTGGIKKLRVRTRRVTEKSCGDSDYHESHCGKLSEAEEQGGASAYNEKGDALSDSPREGLCSLESYARASEGGGGRTRLGGVAHGTRKYRSNREDRKSERHPEVRPKTRGRPSLSPPRTWKCCCRV